MKFLTNFDQKHSHVSELRRCFAKYDRAHIAVAFFKMSGFNTLENSLRAFLKRGGELNMIVGIDLCVTDPDALKGLFDLLKMSPASNLYIKKALPHATFHSKLYLFEAEEAGKVIIGSANMTKGGLAENAELSLTGRWKKTSPVWAEAMAIFQTYLSEAFLADALTIGRYKKAFLSQVQPPAPSMPIFSAHDPDFNYAALKRRLGQLTKKELAGMRAERALKQKKSREVLDTIADDRTLSRQGFARLLDKLVDPGGFWRSGNLFREKRGVCASCKEFAQLVRFIRKHRLRGAAHVFSEAMRLKRELPVRRAGINYVTEIMASYNPVDFAVLNKNSFTVLTREGGVSFGHKRYEAFDGEDYAAFCEIVREICQNLGFATTLEADSFFNEIYWKIKDTD